jgi:hypothetical protein
MMRDLRCSPPSPLVGEAWEYGIADVREEMDVEGSCFDKRGSNELAFVSREERFDGVSFSVPLDLGAGGSTTNVENRPKWSE